MTERACGLCVDYFHRFIVNIVRVACIKVRLIVQKIQCLELCR